MFRYILFLFNGRNIEILPNSGLSVHVLSDGITALLAQVKRAFLVISESTHTYFLRNSTNWA